MTLLFIDSFDHYQKDEIVDKGYSGNDVAHPSLYSHEIEIGTGRRGGNCLKARSPALSGGLAHNIDESSSVVLGVALNFEAFFNTVSYESAIALLDDGAAIIAKVSTTASGELVLESGGVTSTTSTNAFIAGSYAYYELKYTKGTGADGFAELRKDGVVLLTITTSTATENISAFSLPHGSPSAPRDVLVDDLYILNSEGTDNNDYLGDVRVDCHYTIADASETSFVPYISGDNYLMVDDTLTDSDSSFVDAGTIGARDLYDVTLSTTGTTIYGAQHVIHNRKTDAGTVTISAITEKTGGTGEQENGTHKASDDYTFTAVIMEKDPDDGVSDWTDSRLNTTEFGYKISNIEV